ncbi:putative receptor protein kinase ZmPK1 [Tanacetum coccineum]
MVWMANRDEPVNGKRSKLSLEKDGNLVLVDAGRRVIWSTNTKSTSPLVQLQLNNTGSFSIMIVFFDYFMIPEKQLRYTGLIPVHTSDGLKSVSADYGIVRQRIMKIDTDGNLRLYSLAEHENGMKWEIQWQAMSHSCKIYVKRGRGGACVVYKGRLSDNRIAAIKRLNNTNNQGEAEFQAEVSTIGRVNHMNLIEMWGYCAEGKHRLIVYEYMENGSLAHNLGISKLDWATRFSIATGTAKGLAYLHEDCLECDSDQWNFSVMRGTRGYMAPEWVLNYSVTSKVDVFSYGVVILEMITGRSPCMHQADDENCKSEHGLVNWVRDKIHEFDGSLTESWVDKIVDPSISSEYDRSTMENLVKIALQCTRR